MLLEEFARDICDYFETLPQVKQCRLYGSLSRKTFDKYSDIDLELDVSGIDNGRFLLELPNLLSKKIQIIFYDYAPSLAPEKYVVSVATKEENPFMLVDISCVATPHFSTVTKQELRSRNNQYDHMTKLFCTNLKHYLRGLACDSEIQKMYKKLFLSETFPFSKKAMLEQVYAWLKNNADEKHAAYIQSFERYLL